MVEIHFDYQVLFPVGLILVGGTIVYWFQYFKNVEHQYYLWVLPWLFGAIVAGGYVGWLLGGAWPTIWARIAFTIGGCVLGFIAGVLGLMSDPKLEQGPVDQYATTLALLGMPVGVVIGMHVYNIWIVPGPVVGFCIGPLLLGLLVTLLIALPRKLATWAKGRFCQVG